ncbi:MAG: hypothetical protein IPM61_14875 [Chlorobi bacterium]|nr:MAG: hypothetical protein UZ07_CHB004001902 [Chlorobi bacterium OLB7]MBK8912594.1 hypothetical protein [Chlorobiota bacterium]
MAKSIPLPSQTTQNSRLQRLGPMPQLFSTLLGNVFATNIQPSNAI